MASPTQGHDSCARVLGVFAKRPVPGQVKTRLAAETSLAWAARVAEAFLLDLVDRLASVAARRVLVYAPADAEAYFREISAGRFELVPQEASGDLGRRMAAFFTAEQLRGASKVVLLGCDSPTLPIAHIEQAFGELACADVVLGPANDGGYYLVGCGPRLPPIFDDVEWSSARVLADTVARLADPSWRLALLPPWYDVDTYQDWKTLHGHVQALRRAGMAPGVPHTERLPDWEPTNEE
jgi:rSAM/selenodomain-associated transferase 1